MHTRTCTHIDDLGHGNGECVKRKKAEELKTEMEGVEAIWRLDFCSGTTVKFLLFSKPVICHSLSYLFSLCVILQHVWAVASVHYQAPKQTGVRFFRQCADAGAHTLGLQAHTCAFMLSVRLFSVCWLTPGDPCCCFPPLPFAHMRLISHSTSYLSHLSALVLVSFIISAVATSAIEAGAVWSLKEFHSSVKHAYLKNLPHSPTEWHIKCEWHWVLIRCLWPAALSRLTVQLVVNDQDVNACIDGFIQSAAAENKTFSRLWEHAKYSSMVFIF